MSRFAFPGKYAIRPVKNGKGKVLCFATVVDTELGIEFRDVKLIDGKDGVFVSAPSRTYEDKDGKEQYSAYWRAAYDEDTKSRNEKGSKYESEMAKAIERAYRAAVDGSDDERSSSRSSSDSAPRRSARGPVPPRVDEGEAGTKNKLPF